MKAVIFDIQRNSYVDGPGIRTTVFFKGCNLRCRWCHNPESWQPEPQMLFYKKRCISCGKCLSVCPEHSESCILCGRCTLFCPQDAREICGKTYTVEEVFREVVKDRQYYQSSGGGVTCSGGECMLQAELLTELLRLCKENGIHTAVDTAGNVPWESFLSILPYTDLFLYDVKCLTEEKHIAGTGVSNRLILDNLQKLSAEFAGDICIRIPVIPGFNDMPDEMEKIAVFLQKIRQCSVEFLPYHGLGEHKYEALDMAAEKFSVPSGEIMEKCRNILYRQSIVPKPISEMEKG